jgi:hypothetical protein
VLAGSVPFSASGLLDQTGTGTGTGGVGSDPVGVKAAKAAAPEIAQAFFDELSHDHLISKHSQGVLTEGQPFEGMLTRSDWGALDESDIVVSQNSWFTADPVTGEVVGVAWGTFDITKGSGNDLGGEYAAFIRGVIGPDYLFGAECDGSGLFVRVNDEGIWKVDPSKVSGAYEKLGPTGMLGDFKARAAGCLGDEKAILVINGERSNGSGDGDANAASFSDSDDDDDDKKGKKGKRGDKDDDDKKDKKDKKEKRGGKHRD